MSRESDGFDLAEAKQAACVVFAGPPASGKGTQSRQLAASLDVIHLSTGSRLRKEVAAGTAEGVRADDFLQNALYVPDELMVELVGKWLPEPGSGWVLDGFPRSVPQIEALDRLLAQRGETLLVVVALYADEQELLRRVLDRLECPACNFTTTNAEGTTCPKCGAPLQTRADDGEATFHKRMAVYRELTEPVVEVYRKRGLLFQVSAMDSIAQVGAAIQREVSDRLLSQREEC